MNRVLAVVMLVACGGARSGGGQTSRPDPRTDAGASGSGSAVVGEPTPTEQDCDALIGHALELELASRPAEQRLDETERTDVRAQLRQRFGPRCRELPAATYRCLVAATTLTALQSCDERDQRTFRSSTSKTSVALAGMTPAAPRSP